MSNTTSPSSGPRTGRSGDAPFLQGIVEAWDATAGTNIVRVRGSACDNLQSLLGPEAGLIRAGDSVIVIQLSNTYAVLGRVEPPGVAPRAFGIVTDREPTQEDWNTSTGPNFITLPGGPSVSVYIGSSRRCRVDLSAYMSAYEGDVFVGFTVSGASTIAADYMKALALGANQVPGADPVSVYGSSTRAVYLSAADGLNEGINVFTMVYRMGLNIPTGGGTLADREITVQPF